MIFGSSCTANDSCLLVGFCPIRVSLVASKTEMFLLMEGKSDGKTQDESVLCMKTSFNYGIELNKYLFNSEKQ